MNFRTKTPAIRMNTEMLNAFLPIEMSEIFTGWFYYYLLILVKYGNIQTLYQQCVMALLWKHDTLPIVCNGFIWKHLQTLCVMASCKAFTDTLPIA